MVPKHVNGKAGYNQVRALASKSEKLVNGHYVLEGEVLTEKNIRSIRPGYGMSPKYLPDIIGKKISKPIKRGTPLKWNLIRD